MIEPFGKQWIAMRDICWVAIAAALSAVVNIDAPMLAATSSGG